MTDFQSIQQKWQKKWQTAKIFEVDRDSRKKKFYCLEMFPYPSAAFLHMGHVRNYTIGDIIARFKRMQGYNVLYPMGYDSFGLPAENAAKKEGIHPRKYTEQAIAKIMAYQKGLGNSYDWSRVIATHNPQYYQWNQFLFLKLLEKGLVYRKTSPVNWCPKDNSVLADEEVIQGRCWRHEDTPVEKKELEQWFMKTTAYADELLEDIDALQWSDRIKQLQRNWIGKSEGTLITFQIKGSKNTLQVFTTRPDTIFGVTFVTVSPKHKLIPELLKENRSTFEKLAKAVQSEEEKEKEGVFLGSSVINPFTGEEVPVFAANFVVAEYGTGAVMGVPAHDKRDFDFARKYSLNIKTVITPKENPAFQVTDAAYVDEGILVNSGEFSKLDNMHAIQKISVFAEKNKFGKKTVQYKLRDWLFSRQRYWGTPIPIVYCEKCGVVPVAYKNLPIVLPEKVDFTKGGNPLATATAWVSTKCPSCKGAAKRETDTMGTFVDSSWYYLRYCSPHNAKEPFDRKAIDYWMPVDQYVGGIEHAVGHLLYARFITKALRDLGMLNIDEPFIALFNQGIVYKDGHKMSKSFGNVVYQTDISDKYGIDTARVFLMFVAAPDSDMEWSDQGVEGSFRLLQKISRIAELPFAKPTEIDEHKRHGTIQQYTTLLNQFKFNTAIIALMQYAEYLTDHPTRNGYEDLLKLLSLFAPHTAEELWHTIGNKTFVSVEKWPVADRKKIRPEIEQVLAFAEATKGDINEIQKLAKLEKVSNVMLIIASDWKYGFMKKFKVLIEKERDIGKLIKSLVDKEHGAEISKLVPMLTKNPAKVPLVVLTWKEEMAALESFQSSLEKEFGCRVSIEREEKSTEAKARNALPGKPAIILA